MILWSHRGYTNNDKSKENTLTSLTNAYDKGYRNIEFDIWYLNGELLLKHDKPTEEELQDNKLIKLKDFLSVYKNEMNYWMDFKNISEENIDELLNYYKKIIDKVGINYNQIYFAPCETDWNKAIKFQNKLLEKLPKINQMLITYEKVFDKTKLDEYYKILKENNIKYLSIEHVLINEKLIETFKGITLFAWTVDEINDYDRLKKLGINNICTNKFVYENIK